MSQGPVLKFSQSSGLPDLTAENDAADSARLEVPDAISQLQTLEEQAQSILRQFSLSYQPEVVARLRVLIFEFMFANSAERTAQVMEKVRHLNHPYAITGYLNLLRKFSMDQERQDMLLEKLMLSPDPFQRARMIRSLNGLPIASLDECIWVAEAMSMTGVEICEKALGLARRYEKHPVFSYFFLEMAKTGSAEVLDEFSNLIEHCLRMGKEDLFSALKPIIEEASTGNVAVIKMMMRSFIEAWSTPFQDFRMAN